jgi:hypothetical protein
MRPRAKAENHRRAKEAIVEAVSSGRYTDAEIARLLKIHRAVVSRIVSQRPPQIHIVGFWKILR